MIIRCPHIVTMTAERPDYLVVDDGTISHLGAGAPPLDTSHEVLDIPDCAVLPGFIDTHVHLLQTGLNLDAADLTGAASLDELLDILAQARRCGGAWLTGHGFDETLFPDGRYPESSDIDRAVRDIPVFLSRRDHHSCVVNSKALETLELPGGLATGETRRGIFRGEANGWVRRCVYRTRTKDDRRRALDRAASLAVSKGITTVHALEGGSLFGNENIDEVIDCAPGLPVDVVVYPQTDDVEWVRSRGLPRLGGCLLIDGSFGSRTAALCDPYHDAPSESGNLYFTKQSLRSLVKKAHKANLQLAFHAIGDRAIRMLCDAYEEVITREAPWDCRHRIEHCELPAPGDIERIAALNLHCAVQPAFEHFWGGRGKMYEKRLGARRAARTNPLGTFTEMGIPMGGGSDSDVTPMDPLLGISSALAHPQRDQRLTPMAALALFTSAAAWMAFEEDRKGTIEVGKSADLVILDGNPLEKAPDEIMSLRVLGTVVRGRRVYGKEVPR